MHVSSEEALILILYSLHHLIFTFSATLEVHKAFKQYLYPKTPSYQVMPGKNMDYIPVRRLQIFVPLRYAEKKKSLWNTIKGKSFYFFIASDHLNARQNSASHFSTQIPRRKKKKLYFDKELMSVPDNHSNGDPRIPSGWLAHSKNNSVRWQTL